MSTLERTTTAPHLEAGQRLQQSEFHARYHAMPPGIRAELIGGVVVMPSPLADRHGVVGNNSSTWIGVYKCRTPGTEASDNTTTILNDDNEFQPDGSLRIKTTKGGQIRKIGKYIGGCPELVVEVAASSRSIDLGAKLAEYDRAGAMEYVVFAIESDEVFWHRRIGGRLVRIDPDADGLYRSAAFPGLWLDPVALFADDGLALMASLDRGLASDDHARFVGDLATR